MAALEATWTGAVPRAERKRFRLAAILMNLWAYPLMVLWTVVSVLVFPFFLVAWKLVTRWELGKVMRHLIWLYGRGWIAIMSPFVRFRREGFRELRLEPPAVIVVNHLSFFDTYVTALIPFFDGTFAVRTWPFRALFWYRGFMHLAGYLDVERMGWEEILTRAREVFARRGYVLFFPEGHRSRDGKLHRFHSGAFKIAVETGVPVIPVLVSGTDVLLPPGRFWLQPARVTLRALPPVSPVGLPGDSGHRELRAAVWGVMARHSRA